MSNINDIVYLQTEKDEIIHYLSDNLLINNLKTQLSNTLDKVVADNNVLKVIDERYQYISLRYKDNKDIMDSIYKNREEIYELVLKEIEEKFGLVSNLTKEYTLPHNYYSYIYNLYDFFIINYKKNLETFFLQYILENRNDIVKNYRIKTDKKDLEVINSRKIIEEYEDTVILYNISEIIDTIINGLEESEFVISLITEEDPFESVNNGIKELLIDGVEESTMDCDFCHNFFSPLKDDSYRYDIINSIKDRYFKLIKKTVEEE